MRRPTVSRVSFRLRSRSLDFWVDVRLRSFQGRWLAVADISGDGEIGVGQEPYEALANALAPLGKEAAAALLADTLLQGITREIT